MPPTIILRLLTLISSAKEPPDIALSNLVVLLHEYFYELNHCFEYEEVDVFTDVSC